MFIIGEKIKDFRFYFFCFKAHFIFIVTCVIFVFSVFQ